MLKFTNLLFATFLFATLTACSGGGGATSTASDTNLTVRFSPSATLLSNGEVLVAGGSGNGVTLSSSELYNPVSKTFSATGSMSTPRGALTATLLPNGKVLIVGGISGQAGGGFLSSAELYDPSTRIFTITGTMNVARSGHSATLLPNDKVLIVGGGLSGQTSAELYDPATGIFTLTGGMNSFRVGHTATLLPNGKVLVAGCTGGDGSNTAELYDPLTGIFSPTGNMNAARGYHTATLLPDGKVLLAGGAQVVGGGSADPYSFLHGSELYDPSTGVFTPTGNMNAPRGFHTATLLPGGKVLIAGGVDTSILSSTELYDPSTESFIFSASMTSARQGHIASLLLSGKVLIAGGTGVGGFLSSAEEYDITNTFTAVGSL